MGVQTTTDDDGRLLISDTAEQRAAAFAEYDRTIAMEKRGHVLSNGWSWERRWQNTFRAIRSSTENPDVLIVYIIERRRAEGLPDLEERA
jgi:hypothetical protein